MATLPNKIASIRSPKTFQQICAICGSLFPLAFFGNFATAGFLPPVAPDWDAQRVVEHYRDHQLGIELSSMLLVIACALYLPLTAAISAQIRRIPNLHYVVSALQLAAGATSAFTFLFPAIILATASYRLDRPAEITQALNDLYWIAMTLPFPPFLVQNYAFAYAVFVDSRPRPLFVKRIAMLNLFVPLMYIPTMAVHCVKGGPLAWNGAYSFWIVGISTNLQITIDSLALLRVIQSEAPSEESTEETRPLLTS